MCVEDKVPAEAEDLITSKAYSRLMLYNGRVHLVQDGNKSLPRSQWWMRPPRIGGHTRWNKVETSIRYSMALILHGKPQFMEQENR